LIYTIIDSSACSVLLVDSGGNIHHYIGLEFGKKLSVATGKRGKNPAIPPLVTCTTRLRDIDDVRFQRGTNKKSRRRNHTMLVHRTNNIL